MKNFDKADINWHKPIGICSDAHGNLLGLQKCLSLFAQLGVDTKFFLGDAVGYMFNEVALIHELYKHKFICLLGNHDQYAIENTPSCSTPRDAISGLAHYKKQLTSAEISYIKQWHTHMDITNPITQTKLLLVHGGPNNHQNEYVYPDGNFDAYDSFSFDMLLCGHTHRPFVKKNKAQQIVNVGSCGFSRDYGFLLSCAVYFPDQDQVKLYRIWIEDQEIVHITGDLRIHPNVVDTFARQQAKKSQRIPLMRELADKQQHLWVP